MDLGKNLVSIKMENIDPSERAEYLFGVDTEYLEEWGCTGVCFEQTKIINEKNVTISELYKKIMYMKDDFLKIDRNMKVCNDKIKILETNEARMNKEVEELKLQKFEADRMVEILRVRLSGSKEMESGLRGRLSESEEMEKGLKAKYMEVCGILDRLSRQKLASEAQIVELEETVRRSGEEKTEKYRIVEELRRQKMVAEEAAEIQRIQHEKAVQEMAGKLEEADSMANELRQTVEELKQQNLAAYKAAQVFNNKFDDLTAGLDNLLSAIKDDAVNLEKNEGGLDIFPAFSIGKRSSSGSGTGRGIRWLQERDNTSLARDTFGITEKLGNENETDCMVISVMPSNRKRSKLGNENELVNLETDSVLDDVDESFTVANKAAQVFENKFDDLTAGLGNLSSSTIEDVVNLKNTNEGVKSARVRGSVFGSVYSRHTRLHERGAENTSLAREIMDSDEETNPDRAANMCTNLSETENIICRKRSKLGNENEIDEEQNQESTHHEHSFSRGKNNSSKKWMCGAHMLEAFEEDEELCMNAMCALYRVSARESLCHFEMMRGRDLAECLIDGDPELRLKKSVSEIKRHFPDAINECRILARSYYEKLYMLHCSGEDRFFRPI
ncbi:hypothetical protein ABFX02_01G065700 [Erythranthe guttata]